MGSGYFNEATRVQMPGMVHLTRLGYKYYGKIKEEQKGIDYDGDTNILIKEFKKKFEELNPEHKEEFEQVLHDIKDELGYDDLGKSFYKRLISISPLKLIDYDNPENNSFYFTGEFTCKNGEDEFRPDITIFINGLPLVFIEVKKPNNSGGMVAEIKRMNNIRFPNKKFRRFINITQLMIFSNNMEYDAEGGIVPIQGAFYCTGARKDTKFNCFREETLHGKEIPTFIEEFPYQKIDSEIEEKILFDFNNQVIHNTPEYQSNLKINTPTNRIMTSMCSKERILYLLKYGITYVRMDREDEDGKIESIDEKHVMRYQQFFASLTVKRKISEGVKSGIIWHTQGSGKTALSYNLSHVLSDYFAKQNIVTKFYFIVDRIDLLKQAKQEFEARGVDVQTANSREELMNQFKSNQSQTGTTGQHEITVVNIQKFEEDNTKIELPEYANNLQRIFIIDEAHRGYNPKGSFLANLLNADKNAIKIALTGTPLLKEERESWRVFGNYLHTYYYDKSIQDGYTLKIIREDVETSYKEKLSQIYESLEKLVKKEDVKKSYIVEHENYVEELLRYVISDLKSFRTIQGDNTLGGMIICETSEQARKLFASFDKIQNELNEYASNKSHMKAGLILYDSDDKETQEKIIKDFKKNFTIDVLIVFNMLLTGFDAPRLKRLYFGRKLKDHNLLQAITRVNRPYKDNKYGYIIDFADIKQNFDETNEAYLKELNKFNNPEEVGENIPATFIQVIEDKDELINQMRELRQQLFNYSTDNVEEFSSEISTLEDKAELLKLKKTLALARDCCNIVKTFGDEELKEAFAKLELNKLPQMLSEVQRQIDLINQKEIFANDDTTKILVNKAMVDIKFKFNVVSTEEMKLISGTQELDEKFAKAVNSFCNNVDHDDPEYITLHDAFVQRFKEKGFVIDNIEQFRKYSFEMDEVIKKLTELNQKNKVILSRYNGDAKFARVHKRIAEENKLREESHKEPIVSKFEMEIMDVLQIIKKDIDQKVYDRNDILRQDAYFEKTVMQLIAQCMDELNLNSTREDRLFIQTRLTKEYMNQYKETYPEVA